MLENLVITNEAKTQIKDIKPKKAIDVFCGISREVIIFYEKLTGKKELIFLSKEHGIIISDKIISAYHVNEKDDIQNKEEIKKKLLVYFKNAKNIFIFLPSSWSSIIFDIDIWNNCNAKCVYFSAGSRSIEKIKKLSNQCNFTILYIERKGLARIGKKNKKKMLEHLGYITG
jgi:hypothetical protein